MKLSTGFTIIELVVVIAILAVLAAIILANVMYYQTASKNAAIRANLVQLIPAGVAWFESGRLGTGNYVGTYQNFCNINPSYGNPAWISVRSAIYAIKLINPVCMCDIGLSCTSIASKWCACSAEAGTTDTFCIDSSGYKGESILSCGARCYNGGGQCH